MKHDKKRKKAKPTHCPKQAVSNTSHSTLVSLITFWKKENMLLMSYSVLKHFSILGHFSCPLTLSCSGCTWACAQCRATRVVSTYSHGLRCLARSTIQAIERYPQLHVSVCKALLSYTALPYSLAFVFRSALCKDTLLTCSFLSSTRSTERS